MEPNAIAEAFVRRYERFWHDGRQTCRGYTRQMPFSADTRSLDPLEVWGSFSG